MMTAELAQKVSLNRVLKIVKDQGGFMNNDQLKVIAIHDRLRLILVRCGNGRFLTPAQDVEHFCGIIKKEDSDYVRDLSLPNNDPVWNLMRSLS